MLDVGCWMLDVGCWMLDVGCWMFLRFMVRGNSNQSVITNQKWYQVPLRQCSCLARRNCHLSTLNHPSSPPVHHSFGIGGCIFCFWATLRFSLSCYHSVMNDDICRNRGNEALISLLVLGGTGYQPVAVGNLPTALTHTLPTIFAKRTQTSLDFISDYEKQRTKQTQPFYAN